MERLTTENRSRAADLLLSGAVVAMPTDTVYGVAATVGQESAARAIYELKGRPDHLALPVMIGERWQLADLGATLTDREAAVADRFWPGPLTVVLAASPDVARRAGSTDGTVGVRLPDDGWLRALLLVTGPLLVTSANRHGAPPARSASEVATALEGADGLAAVVDGGWRDGPVSTVVTITSSDLVVHRAGAIADADLRGALGSNGEIGGR